jgi:CTP:molybdopterin cytidylyltransferase MocA
MTVAAVILAASEASALADADGTPAVRRLADIAWAGGATPVVVCSFDPDGSVAAALANTQAMLVEPVAVALGPVGQIAAGCEAAVRLVVETDAALVWPARFGWVDAGTVTALIAAHGEARDAVLRPVFGGEDGFPVLLPMTHLAAFRAQAADRMPGELFGDLAAAGVPVRSIDTGDPGVTHDVSVMRAELPLYQGPPEPADAHAHEWGAAAADDPDDAPVPGSARIVSTKPGS